MKKSPKIKLSPLLLRQIKQFCDGNNEVILVSLCTTDGFSIKTFATNAVTAEEDKIAAMASTLCALSNSSAQQIVNQEFCTTTIETNESHFLFLRTDYLGTPIVLTIVLNEKMNLATARFNAKRLAEMINSISA